MSGQARPQVIVNQQRAIVNQQQSIPAGIPESAARCRYNWFRGVENGTWKSMKTIFLLVLMASIMMASHYKPPVPLALRRLVKR